MLLTWTNKMEASTKLFTPDVDARPAKSLSPAYLVAIFIILQLCNLVQPYGCLLYRNAGGFCWRVNPISSFTEACLILYNLMLALIKPERFGKGGRTVVLQQVSMCLLMTRATNAVGKGPSLLVELLYFKPKKSPAGLREAIVNGKTTMTSSDTIPEQGEATLLPTDPSSSVTYSKPEDDSTPWVNMPQNTDAALNHKAWVRRDPRTDILALAAQGCIVALFLMTTCGYFITGIGVFAILGWAAVQSLIWVFKYRNMDRLELRWTIAVAFRFEEELALQMKFWNGLHIGLHLILFAYLCYFPAFYPWISLNATGWPGFMRDMWRIFETSSAAGVSGSFIIAFTAVFKDFDRVQEVATSLIAVMQLSSAGIFGLWLAIAAQSRYQQTCNPKADNYNVYDGVGYVPCFPRFRNGFFSTNLFRLIFDESFEVIHNAVISVIFLLPLMLAYTIFTIPGGIDWYPIKVLEPYMGPFIGMAKSIPQRRVPILNAICVVFAFAVFVLSRNSDTALSNEAKSALA